jgi:hypothetical protein
MVQGAASAALFFFVITCSCYQQSDVCPSCRYRSATRNASFRV